MLAISEILEKASKMKKKEEKVEFLRQNGTPALQTILVYAMDPNVKSALPEGPAPYTPADLADENVGTLHSYIDKLYLFCEGGHPNLKQSRREQIYIQMLESIHPKDAAMMVAAKDKQLPYKGITKEIVNAAFPGLIS
jgi:hypothetical protein